MAAGRLTANFRADVFPLERLPHLARPVVEWTKMLARVRAALPRLLAAEFPHLGRLEIRPGRLAFVTEPDRRGESLALEVRGRPLRLQIDPALALRLVGAVVGESAPTEVRPLKPSERGVLMAVVVALLDSAKLAHQVRVLLEEPAPPAPADLIAVDLRIIAYDFSGKAHLELPPAALPSLFSAASVWSRGGPAARPDTVVDLLLTDYDGIVELACTTLTRGEAARAKRGDAVTFDVRPPGAEPWPVVLRCGDCVIPAHLDAEGTLHARAPLSLHPGEIPAIDVGRDRIPSASEVSTMDMEPDTVPNPNDLSDDAARLLATAPVEIVAELGRIRVRGEELIGLLEGGALSLGIRRPTRIQLRVAGRLWAMGELIVIDNELGVRITEIIHQR